MQRGDLVNFFDVHGIRSAEVTRVNDDSTLNLAVYRAGCDTEQHRNVHRDESVMDDQSWHFAEGCRA